MSNGFEKFDDYFKQGLEDFEQTPPPQIWEQIAPELPVYTPTPFYTQKRVWAGIAVCMLLLLSSTLYFFNNYSIEASFNIHPKNTQEHTSFSHINISPTNSNSTSKRTHDLLGENCEEAASQNLLASTDPNVVVSKVAKDNSLFTPTSNAGKAHFYKPALFNNLLGANLGFTVSQSKPIVVINSSSDIDANVSSEKIQNQSTLVSKRTTIPYLATLQSIPQKDLKNTALAQKEPNLQPKLKTLASSTAKTTGFSVGAFAQYQNVWTLNKAPKESAKNGYTKYSPGYGYAYGFSLSYDFSNTTGIQAEWIVNSSVSQNAEYHDGGNVYYGKSQGQYMQFPVLFKYKKTKQSKLTNQAVVLNHLVGLQYGYLKSSPSILLNNTENPTSDEFRIDNNFGLVLGMGYDVYLSPRTMFSLAARTSFNRRINSFHKFINETHPNINVLFGVQASMKYRFK